MPVLIETLWNVKITHAYAIENGAFVLIETLWNVKREYQGNFANGLVGINRNIVECKDGYFVFNETSGIQY